ncbi:GTPase [Aureococcus anophagefferens]|nr:GTPase [Aureococcus anophagefferens]
MAENTHANNTVTSTLDSLPRELQEVALDYADVYDLGGAAVACRDLREVVEDVLRTARVARGRGAAADADTGPVFRVHRPARVPAGGLRFISVATHSFHTLALTASGEVYSFGHGGCGQLGHGDQESSATPRRVDALAGALWWRCPAGSSTRRLTDRGAPYAFGSGFGGKTGLGDQRSRSLPRRVAGIPEPVAVLTAGAHHSLGATTSGAVTPGPTPTSSWACRSAATRTRRGASTRSTAASCSSPAASTTPWPPTRRGLLLGAGEAERTSVMVGGFLGHRSLDDAARPRRVEGLAGVRIVASSAGALHSLVLSAAGDVYSFGHGGGGRLGHGDSAMRWVPERVAALAGVAAIAAGDAHSACALRDGAVFTWGCGRALGLPADAMTLVDLPVLGERGQPRVGAGRRGPALGRRRADAAPPRAVRGRC